MMNMVQTYRIPLAKFIILAVALLAFASPAAAQLHLTLDRTIALAQDSALQALSAKHNLALSRTTYDEFLAGRKLNLQATASPSYSYKSIDRTTSASSLSDFNQLTSALTLKMTQQVNSFGGNLYAFSSLSNDLYLGAMREHYNDIYGTTTQFQVIPIMVGYQQDVLGYNAFKWEKKLQDYRITTQEQQYAYQLAQVAEQAASYFFQYATAKAFYEMYKQNVDVADSLYKIGQQKYNIMAINKAELISLELQLLNSQNSLFSYEKEMHNAATSLLNFLGLPPSTELSIELPQEPARLIISEDEALHWAMENNPTLRNQQENIILAEQEVDLARRESGFHTSVDLSVGGQNFANTFSEAYSGTRFSTAMGVTFVVPIIDMGRARLRVAKARQNLDLQNINLEEAQRNLRTEICNALRDFNLAQQQLSQTAKTLRLADASFELNQYNYAQGLADISTFTFAQQRKDEAHNNYITALRGYWTSYYKLSRLTMHDFRK